MLSPERNQQGAPINYSMTNQASSSVSRSQPLPPTEVTDLVPTHREPTGNQLTRVMSPTTMAMQYNSALVFGGGQGWVQVIPCPRCNVFVEDPVICSGCGVYGHPRCIGAELFENLPFCGDCFTNMVSDFAKRRDAENREMWRQAQAQQLVVWKSRAINILGLSSQVGNAIGAATASIAGSAFEIAKGVTTGVFEIVENTQSKKLALELSSASSSAPTIPPESSEIHFGKSSERKSMDAILDGTETLTAKEYKQLGHCLACWTQNSNHSGHLRYGNCLKTPPEKGLKELQDKSLKVPIPEDEFDGEPTKDDSFHSIEGPKTCESVVQVPATQRETSTQTEGLTMEMLLARILQVEEMNRELEESHYQSSQKQEESNERLDYLESEMIRWNNTYTAHSNEDEELKATGQMPTGLTIPALVDDNREDDAAIERALEQQLLEASDEEVPEGLLQGTHCKDTSVVQRGVVPPPPGLATETQIPGDPMSGARQIPGHQEIVSLPDVERSKAKGFEDCFNFFKHGPNHQRAGAGSTPNQQHGNDGPQNVGGHQTPTTNRAAHAEQAAAVPTTLATRETPSDSLSQGELSMILKSMQQVGEFPQIELGQASERPMNFRRWRYAVTSAMESAGIHVTDWWQWSLQIAEQHHRVYVQAPIMARESIVIADTVPNKWRQLELWFRPRVLACLPQVLKKTLTQRGVDGMRDEVQDILFLVFKTIAPGAADEKNAVLRMLQNPVPCSKPETALAEIQRYWSAARRCDELMMNPPDVTILYTAFQSIFSNVFDGATGAMQLRWLQLQNELNLPQVITHDKMMRVASFAQGELQYMVIQGGRTGNPGLPMTDNQQKQEQQKKDNEGKNKRAAALKADGAWRNTAPEPDPTGKGGASPQAAAATYGNRELSRPTTWWKGVCRDWAMGSCVKGINCGFQHDGIPKDAGRCFICGKEGHSTTECTCPGGGKDPEKDKRWTAYQAIRDKENEKLGKGKGKKGKGSKGKGDNGKNGKDPWGGAPFKTARTVRVSALRSTKDFPKDGVGIDSWANVMLVHKKGPLAKKQVLKLADGETECEIGEGDKGVPLAIVPHIDGKENIDLLPQGWLWSRGCDFKWGSTGFELETPKGSSLSVHMWGRMPYIRGKDVEKLFEDLPPKEEEGRDSDEEQPHASAARVARTMITERQSLEHLKGEVDSITLTNMVAKYKCLPERYYLDSDKVVTPEGLSQWLHHEKNESTHKDAEGPMFDFWEWYAGSGAMSKRAADKGISHLPPIDFRYGWSIARLSNQLLLLQALLFKGVASLFAAPNCFPWGKDSRMNPWEKTKKKRRAEFSNLQFLAVCCFIQILLDRSYYIENPEGSDIFKHEMSPLALLRKLLHFIRKVDQCMRGAKLEEKFVKKGTELQSNEPMKDDVKCDGTHDHLHLRGSGPGGSRTAQSALYAQDLCDDWLDEMVPSDKEGGRTVDAQTKEETTREPDIMMILKKLSELKVIAKNKGLMQQWNEIVEPWLATSLIKATSTPDTSLPTLVTNTERVAANVTDIFKDVTGELSAEPWQNKKYNKKSAVWQAAGQRRHMHRRHGNQSIGVCSVDLSGPHEGTPQPNQRIQSNQAHYFLVLSIKLGNPKEEDSPQPEAPEGSPQPEAPPDDPPEEVPALVQEEVQEEFMKPILYVALLAKKSEAASKIQELLALVRSEFGNMPDRLVYRLHSDLGGEFINAELKEYLNFHGITHSTTQGYDPSANGAAENGVGLIKKRGRYLLCGNRFSTRWWGMCVLAAALLYRVDAGVATAPKIPFGTIVMVNIDPVPRNAWLPRAMPATIFGPCDSIPNGMWVYQNGKVFPKVNIQTAGMTEEEINIVKASWDDYEIPISRVAPPSNGLYEAMNADLPSSVEAATFLSATCPACKCKSRGEPIAVPHSKVYGKCAEAAIPPQPISSILPQEDEVEPPAEGLKPEELPEPVLITNEELFENLDICPDPEARFRFLDSSVSKCVSAVPKDLVDSLAIHPHAAIAWSDESSISWMRESGSKSSECSDLPELKEDSEADEDLDRDILICGNCDPEAETVDESDSDGDVQSTFRHIFQSNRRSKSPAKAEKKVRFVDDLIGNPPRPLQKKVRRRHAKIKSMYEDLDSKQKVTFLRACSTLLGSDGENVDVPDAPVHGLEQDQDITEPDVKPVTPAEVRASTGATAEGWRAAVEREFVENFVQRNVFTVTTEDERRRHGSPLPMKLVFTLKKLVQRCRAVACGNFEKDPTKQLWTAQAEVASLVAAVRLGVSLGWQIGAVDVSGAFMYAPLPEHMLVVVRPPQFFIDIGLAKPGELWTLHRAVYGLKISPRAWGTFRDKTFRECVWEAEGETYFLQQCSSDTQVWKIVSKSDPSRLLGLMVVYVDDFLILCPAGQMRTKFIEALRKVWKIKEEQVLDADHDLTFLGLEFRSVKGGVKVGQWKFLDILLEKHGIKADTKPILTVTMDVPGDPDPPTPGALKELQGHAGEFNWLATRCRADLAYYVSLLASALTKHSGWSFTLVKKILRYLHGTRESHMFIPELGNLSELIAWSDAGFAGISSKSQTGILVMWGGCTILWRSSRQTVSALCTAEAELVAAALCFQVVQGLKILLQEWGLIFDCSVIKVDNTAAIVIAENGGSWRTRYFSVRGNRICEEIQQGTIKLEHEPTGRMLADGLTKLGTNDMLSNIRNAMLGKLPSAL